MKDINRPIFGDYELEDSFAIPAKPGSFPVFDDLSDGRMIVTDGPVISVETGKCSREFRKLRDVPAAYASFLRVSPSGRQVAVGDGTNIRVFDLETPNKEATFPVANYDAEWVDDDLILTSGPNNVTAINKKTAAATIVVQGIGGASAGVAIDRDGNLYTGNGLRGPGPSDTGAIKAFSRKAWARALSGGSAVDFEKEGILVAQLLSAGYLSFDRDGHLFVGGGNAFGGGDTPGGGDRGYAAAVSASAISYALRGGQPVVPGFPSGKLHEFDPDPKPDDFYYVDANAITGEVYLSDFGQTTVYAYRRIARRDRILAMTCDLHFGDNAGIFFGAAYVGNELSLPMRLEWVNDRPEVKKVRFIFGTHDIETWSQWQGHPVYINDRVIGHLKDDEDVRPDGRETHVLSVDKADFIALVGKDKRFNLRIVLGRQPDNPGLADDFVLTRIETTDCVVKLGLK